MCSREAFVDVGFNVCSLVNGYTWDSFVFYLNFTDESRNTKYIGKQCILQFKCISYHIVLQYFYDKTYIFVKSGLQLYHISTSGTKLIFLPNKVYFQNQWQ